MTVEESFLQLSRVILPVVATGTDLSLEPIGTAFIICADGKLALALTAAHNIYYIDKIDRPYDLCHETTLPEFRPRISSIELRNTSMRVLYPDKNGNHYMPQLSQAYVVEPFDIAICVLHISDDLPSDLFFDNKLLIDSSLPKVGTPVSAIGYSQMYVASHVMEGRSARATQKATLNRRNGTISHVYSDVGPRNQLWPCFQCTIPFDHGMSGGPIMDLSEERTAAIGIISSDSSFDPSHRGSGENALASVLWPAMCTRMRGEMLKGHYEPRLLEFERMGLIEDRGNAHKHIKYSEGEGADDLIMAWQEIGLSTTDTPVDQ